MAEKTVPENHDPKHAVKHAPETREPGRYLVPAVDIYETDDGLTLVADVPGVAKEGLDVGVEDGVLTITGAVPETGADEATYGEYDLAPYWRQFHLGDELDVEKIHADLSNGVLTVSLPKAEKAKPKKIAVTVA
jgi:HSP20 family molecular chaperone IbpA